MADTRRQALSTADFDAFFSALWSDRDGAPVRCFEWQRQFVQEAARDRRWPQLVDLPTGTGKTSLLEIAVFLQALDAERPPTDRWMPRRVLLVVDRRVVVDQADARGTRIADALHRAHDGVLAVVADRLRGLFDGQASDPPLVTSVLRGGIVRDESWARRPDVPALISSTVDQVGSRLLFRGYGVGAGMRPVQAGLLANDCLFLLDEVHLARPFAETLSALAPYRQWAQQPDALGPHRWQVVEMSATPVSGASGTRFPGRPLDPDSDPVLRRRLTASKLARLVSVTPSGFVAGCAREAIAMARRDEATRTIGVVVNRVRTASDIADELEAAVTRHRLAADVVLITGRMRSFDRDALVRQIQPRLRVGRHRLGTEPRLFVVATQSIEAGADFDLDGLVTECASLDALRQRFGRVDRDGRLSEGPGPAQNVILARTSDLAPRATDPVYGDALAATWRWLDALDEIDFGIRRLPTPDADALAAMSPPQRRAPKLLPAHLDIWVQTAPTPAVEPDVSQWLHGIDTDVAEVQIVWRSDLTEELLAGSEDDDPDDATRRHDAAAQHVMACPPASGELLALSVGVVRRWLRTQPTPDLTDAGEFEVEMGDDDRRPPLQRLAVRWDGKDTRVVAPDQIRPGDVLVVPATYGGLRRGSWAPTLDRRDDADGGRRSVAVADVALEAIAEQRDLAVLRLTTAAWRDTELPGPDELLAMAASERHDAVRSWLDRVADGVRSAAEMADDADRDTGMPHEELSEAAKLATVLGTRGASMQALRLQVVPGPGANAGVPPALVVTVPLRRRRSRPVQGPGTLGLDADAGGDLPSFTGKPDVGLDAHLSGVTAWAGILARRAGLPEPIVHDLELAARLHDVGKVDPRFQVWLLGGDETAYDPARPLAKSPVAQYDRARRDAARTRAGYPREARHELASVAMCAQAQALADEAHDWELVLHLIASHHGLCRPLPPIGHDPAPQVLTHEVDGVRLSASSAHELARLDSGIAQRFWRLIRRYGWFGLAQLEAILRLADHRRSEDEEVSGSGR